MVKVKFKQLVGVEQRGAPRTCQCCILAYMSVDTRRADICVGQLAR